MNKTELIKEVLAGKAVKTVPFSFWCHYPKIDHDPKALAQQTYANFREFDLDYVKTLNSGMYAIEDYGATIDYRPVMEGGVAELVASPIQTAADWANLAELDVTAPALNRELNYLSQLLDLIEGQAPVIMTIFSPLTTAYKLSGGQVLDHIQAGQGDLVRKALDKIAHTTALLAQEAVKRGASGVYFASQLADQDKTTESIYRDYGLPYDLKALHGAEDGWFNVLHLHGNHIMPNLFKDYPTQVINWHIGESEPSLAQGLADYSQTIMGGLQRMTITHDQKEAIDQQIETAISQSKGQRLLLSPGCGIRLPFKAETIRYIQERKTHYEAIYL